MDAQRGDAQFEVEQERPVSTPVIAGFARYGLAGLTAVDYLVRQLELEPVGFVRAPDLPSITPVTGGRPRHPTRILGNGKQDITVLMGELHIPPMITPEFSNAILQWIDRSGIEEICCLAGVVVPHEPEDHFVSWIATEDYNRVETTNVPPVKEGFLDGVLAALVEKGMSEHQRVGVLTTPVHPQTMDVEAALRLVEAVDELYDLEVDPGPLQQFAQEIEAYYEELAKHFSEQSQPRVPDDRMFM